MRVSPLSLLLLSTAALSMPAAAAPPSDQVAEQVEAPSPPPAPRPPRERTDSPRPMLDRPERRFRDVDTMPEQRATERSWQRARDSAETSPMARASRTEPRSTEPVPVRDTAAVSAGERRREGWSRPAMPSRPREVGGLSEQTWRGGTTEGRSRSRALPPSAGSPVFGSAIPSPGTVTRSPREVSPGSVSQRELRGRIAAEGLRRDRAASDHWRREWRQDRRYDWRRHRDRDRSRFHLGIYIDPFGWRYRGYDVGWRLPAHYYASRYWLNDPWSYRLPPVGGYLRWIRYHDDVLLVDLRTGRVLDRIPDFFW